MKNTIPNLEFLSVEPGEIPYSFTHALASSLHAMGCPLDKKVITGMSGFAFRIWVEVKEQCPSAMSIFDFALLKTAVELCGYSCTHITRLWGDENVEAERLEQAHAAIIAAVDEGRAPIAWDIGVPEWGLIAGYDDEAQIYETINCFGQSGTMPYAQLGKREIPILSVTIPGKPIGKSTAELASDTLKTAIAHARGLEWEDRPGYENGLAAYPAWAALIKSLDQTGFSSRYYVGTYAHLRGCAAAYLEYLANENPKFIPAAQAYASVAAHLKTAEKARNDQAFPSPTLLEAMEQSILAAYEEEKAGVELLEKLLTGN
jgi:hypothetical protein